MRGCEMKATGPGAMPRRRSDASRSADIAHPRLFVALRLVVAGALYVSAMFIAATVQEVAFPAGSGSLIARSIEGFVFVSVVGAWFGLLPLFCLLGVLRIQKDGRLQHLRRLPFGVIVNLGSVLGLVDLFSGSLLRVPYLAAGLLLTVLWPWADGMLASVWGTRQQHDPSSP